MSSEPTPINPRNGNNANIGEGLIWTGKTTGCLVTSKPVNTCSNTDGFPLKDTSWSRERRHQMTRRSKTTGKRETWRKPKTSHPVDKKSPGNSMGYAQSAKTHSSMMRSCKCITRNQKPKGERTTTATSSWYTIFAINKSTQRRRWKMSYRGREVRDLLERLEGRLSRAVLRGLRGSNAHSATRHLDVHGEENKHATGVLPNYRQGPPEPELGRLVRWIDHHSVAQWDHRHLWPASRSGRVAWLAQESA